MLTRLLNIGITESLSFEDSVRIKFHNTAALSFAFVLYYFVFFHLFVTHFYDVAVGQFLISLGVPTTLFLQHKHKYLAAKIVLFVFLHLVVFLTSMVVLVGDGNEYYYLTIAVLILVQNKNNYITGALLALNAFLFILPHLYYPHLNEHYKMMTAIAVYVSIIFSVHFFVLIKQYYEKRLNAQNLKLAELNNEKNDLVSIVAHDLKTPLSQIKGLINILKLDSNLLNEEQLKLLEKIQDVTNNQGKQISKFLNIKALEDAAESPSYHECSVNIAILAVLEQVQTLATAKNIKIETTLSNKELTVLEPPEGLAKIISNLLSNAIKYSFQKTVITVHSKAEADHVLIIIKDQGQGFKKEEMAQVFAKNKVLSALPTAKESASGVGLFIVKKYVDMMNGKIWLESEEEVGSTFFVKLPKS